MPRRPSTSLISRPAQPWLGRLSAPPRDWPTNHHHQRTGHKLCRIALFDLGLHGLQHTTHRAFSSLTAPLESSPWSVLQLQLREVAVLIIKNQTQRLFRESRFRNSKRNTNTPRSWSEAVSIASESLPPSQIPSERADNCQIKVSILSSSFIPGPPSVRLGLGSACLLCLARPDC